MKPRLVVGRALRFAFGVPAVAIGSGCIEVARQINRGCAMIEGQPVAEVRRPLSEVRVARAVRALFADGLDTMEIAVLLARPEADVARLLASTKVKRVGEQADRRA